MICLFYNLWGDSGKRFPQHTLIIFAKFTKPSNNWKLIPWSTFPTRGSNIRHNNDSSCPQC